MIGWDIAKEKTHATKSPCSIEFEAEDHCVAKVSTSPTWQCRGRHTQIFQHCSGQVQTARARLLTAIVLAWSNWS